MQLKSRVQHIGVEPVQARLRLEQLPHHVIIPAIHRFPTNHVITITNIFETYTPRTIEGRCYVCARVLVSGINGAVNRCCEWSVELRVGVGCGVCHSTRALYERSDQLDEHDAQCVELGDVTITSGKRGYAVGDILEELEVGGTGCADYVAKYHKERTKGVRYDRPTFYS